MNINVGLLEWSIIIFIKKSGGAPMFLSKSAIKNENISNKELAEELH